MIEIITILVIIAILAAIGVTSLSGFTDRAKQSARESVAQTIFMAGQTALTHAYNQDRDFYTNNRSPIIPGGDFLSTDELEKLNHNPPALVYLKMDKGGNNGSLPLYTMLSPYLNDKAVLNESILIEYNRETGKMLSAFYSDEPGVTLSYGSGGSYDVRSREDIALKEGKVGYYGVDSTGEVIRPDQLEEEDYSVLLVDHTDPTGPGYGLLTAEIKIKASVWNSDAAATMHFNLSLLPMGAGRVEDLSFSKNQDEYDFTTNELTLINSIERAIDEPREITVGGITRKIPVYMENVTGTIGYCTIVVILDGVQSLDSVETTSICIRDTFPGLQGGFLYAELEAANGADSVSVYSDDKSSLAVHTFYGYDSAADDSRFTVMSVRHLNNIRYNAAGSFEQTQSIYMRDYEGNPLNFKPICNRCDPVAPGGTQYGFSGSYTSDAAYAIIDFKSDLTLQTGIPQTLEERASDKETLLNAGLFDTVLSGGSVSNVRFAVSQPINNKPTLVTRFAGDDTMAASEAIALVKGIHHAGGIAAVNNGRIENCTMMGYVSAKGGDALMDGTAGAIAGSNMGKITRCASLCTVHGERYVGGIAGASGGAVSYCEAGTASWRTWPGGDELHRAGTPAYGASDTQNGIYRGGYETANNTHRLIIMNSNGVVGGIVGYASAEAAVTGCVNACKVESGNFEGSNYTGNIAGGIVGQLYVPNTNNTAVGYCYNAGEVDAASRSGDSGGAGGIVGEVVSGKILNCYNTGTVNLQTRELRYDHDDMTYHVIDRTLNLNTTPPDSSGGLIGHGGDGTVIESCYSAQYTGNAFGGAFGELGADAQVTNCGFLRNIQNKESTYYTGSQAVGLVNAYDTETLRSAPTDENLSSAFVNGSYLNPTGVFKYQYPYLARIQGESNNLPGHRTPYSPTIASYGDIRLNGSMKDNTFIYCTFYIAPPEGYINIYAADRYRENGTPRRLCCIPLLAAPNFNSLTDMRYLEDLDWDQLGERGYIYGYDQDYSEGRDWQSLTPDYTFRIKAHKLDALNENEAEYVAKGYSYRYTIRMVYGTEDKLKESYISSDDYTYIRAELRNTAVGDEKYADSDDIGKCEMSIINPVPSTPTFVNTAARALVISGMPLDETKSIVLEFDYDNLLVQNQGINLDAQPIFSSNAPRTFEEAMDSPLRYTGLSHPAVHTNGFRYYVQDNSDGTKALYLLLWVDQSPTPIDPPARYNGLNEIPENGSVTITVQRGSASVGPKTVCEQKFYSWEP